MHNVILLILCHIIIYAFSVCYYWILVLHFWSYIFSRLLGHRHQVLMKPANSDYILLYSARLKELEDQYTKEKMEHERMFAQQREVGVAFEIFPLPLTFVGLLQNSSWEFIKIVCLPRMSSCCLPFHTVIFGISIMQPLAVELIQCNKYNI